MNPIDIILKFGSQITNPRCPNIYKTTFFSPIGKSKFDEEILDHISKFQNVH